MDSLPILVLDNILSKLAFPDLLQIRSVNKLFKELATGIIKPKLFKVSLRTTAQLTEFTSVHNNSLDPLPFKELILNPNIGTDSQFLEFSKIYANSVTHLYVNILPDDPSFPFEHRRTINFKGKYSSQYDTKVLERITIFLQYAHNIQVLILEPDHDKIGRMNKHYQIETDVGKLFLGRESERPLIRPQIKIPILQNLSVFYCGVSYLREIPWTQRLIRNAPEIKYNISNYDDRVVYLKPGAETDYREVTQYLDRKTLYITENGMQMSQDNLIWKYKKWSCMDSKYFKDVERLSITALEAVNDRSEDFVSRITSGQTINSYVLPQVTTIEVWCVIFRPESVVRLQPSSFPALRCVYIVETPYLEDNLNPFADNIFKTVEELDFEASYDVSNDPYCPWHIIFPNVRKLVTAVGFRDDEQHLSYFLPRFHKIQTLCLTLVPYNNINWKLFTGGIPSLVSFMKLTKLEYRDDHYSNFQPQAQFLAQFLEELVKSSSLEYLNNVTNISISTAWCLSKMIGVNQTLDFLQKLKSKHEYVELVEGSGRIPGQLEGSGFQLVQFYPK